MVIGRLLFDHFVEEQFDVDEVVFAVGAERRLNAQRLQELDAQIFVVFDAQEDLLFLADQVDKEQDIDDDHRKQAKKHLKSIEK